MPKSVECEIKTKNQWERVAIEDVLERRTKGIKLRGILRCPECSGPVRAHKDSENVTGPRAHFEHLRGHEGCSLGNYFGGTRSIHPDALED